MRITKYIIEHRATGPVACIELDTGDVLELPGVCALAASGVVAAARNMERTPQHLYLDIINSADGMFEERRLPPI
jgi:hypothetical protein